MSEHLVEPGLLGTGSTISGPRRSLDTAHRMADYRFSKRAAMDLEVIAEYRI